MAQVYREFRPPGVAAPVGVSLPGTSMLSSLGASCFAGGIAAVPLWFSLPMTLPALFPLSGLALPLTQPILIRCKSVEISPLDGSEQESWRATQWTCWASCCTYTSL